MEPYETDRTTDRPTRTNQGAQPDQTANVPPSRREVPGRQSEGDILMVKGSPGQSSYTSGSTSGSTSGGKYPALLGGDPETLRERWREIQGSFVDEPRDAVQRAHELLDDVSTSVHDAIQARVRDLQDGWKNAGENDTERLRTAMRAYRDALRELMPLGGGQVGEGSLGETRKTRSHSVHDV